MAHFHNNALVGASGQGGYLINQSLRFNRPDTAYLSKIIGAGGATTKNAVSFWVKRSALGTQQALFQGRVDGNNQQYMGFTASNTLEVGIISGGSYILQKITSAVYRDTSAWYHVFFYQDNTLATAEDRYQLYVNGVRVTAWSTNTNTATQSNGYYFGANAQHYIAAYGGANTLDGYLAEFHFIYQPTTTPLVGDFGETDTITGAWIPKKYSGSYGTNGFYLNFSDNSGTTSTTLGKDSSGNGNNWTPNNFSVTAGAGNDVLSDTPTNNWCTLNPLIISSTTTAPTISNGNLFGTFASNDQYPECGAIFSPMGLKGYFELSDSGTQDFLVGFIKTSSNPSKSNYTNSNAFYYDLDNGRIRQGSTTLISSYTTQSVANDIIGIAFDFTGSNRNVWFSLNGSWGNNGSGTGNPATGANPGLTASNLGTTDEYRFYFGFGLGPQVTFNFGQRAFAYTPPTGFKALNTANLPEPTIKKGGKYFNTVLWTGNGTNPRSITGVGFSPDFVWTKKRNTSQDHFLYDAVRGSTNGNFYELRSSSTSAEGVPATANVGMRSLDSDGFTIGSDASVNTNNDTYVGWCWDANGAGSSNTAGTITSTVSGNATAGFSIVTYTSPNNAADQTVGHGLGVKPSLIIVKNRDLTYNWDIYHASLGYNASLIFTTAGTRSGAFGAEPTSTVFTTKTGYTHNSTNTYVAYCFSEVAGYSKFGSYTGNGSSDGPFVFCGFRPRWIMIKVTNVATTSWMIRDTARNPYNIATGYLFPNSSSAEFTNLDFDIYSNGFKPRHTSNVENSSGSNYIFAAFAELPAKYSNAR